MIFVAPGKHLCHLLRNLVVDSFGGWTKHPYITEHSNRKYMEVGITLTVVGHIQPGVYVHFDFLWFRKYDKLHKCNSILRIERIKQSTSIVIFRDFHCNLASFGLQI